MENMLQVGVISSTHGIRGEVKIFPTTDDAMRFKKLKEVILDTGKECLILEIEGVKFFKQFVILKFKGIDNINDVEKYKQCKLFVDRAHAVKLQKDEYFVTDLIGISVYKEDGNLLGILEEVIPTGANDVYVVMDDNNKEWLLPAIKDCIINVDMIEKKMTVRLLKGMED